MERKLKPTKSSNNLRNGTIRSRRDFQLQIIKGLSFKKNDIKQHHQSNPASIRNNRISQDPLDKSSPNLTASNRPVLKMEQQNESFKGNSDSTKSPINNSTPSSPNPNQNDSSWELAIEQLDISEKIKIFKEKENQNKANQEKLKMRRLPSKRKFNYKKNFTIRGSMSFPSLTMMTATSPPQTPPSNKLKLSNSNNNIKSLNSNKINNNNNINNNLCPPPPVPPRSFSGQLYNSSISNFEKRITPPPALLTPPLNFNLLHKNNKINNNNSIDINNNNELSEITDEFSNDETFPDTSELDSVCSSMPSTPIENGSKKNSLSIQQMEMNALATLNELLTTEEDYLRDLDYVIQDIMVPMKKKKFSKNSIESIFSNIEIIRNISSTLIADLKAGSCDINLQNTIKIFKKLHAFLKMYSQYCKNHSKALLAIEDLCKSNSNFSQFLTEISSLPQSRGLRLQDYLIKPIQRICKYPLFFNEILKYTSIDDPIYNELKEVHLKLSEVAEFINEFQKIDESNFKLLKIQNTIEGVPFTIVEASRKFIKDLPVKVERSSLQTSSLKESSSTALSDQRYLYIFNDSLLLARTKKLSNRLLFSLNLPYIYTIISLPTDSNNNNNSYLTLKGYNYNNVLTVSVDLYFTTLEERDEIYRLLNNHITEYREMYQKLKSRGADRTDESSASVQLWVDNGELSLEVHNSTGLYWSNNNSSNKSPYNSQQNLASLASSSTTITTTSTTTMTTTTMTTTTTTTSTTTPTLLPLKFSGFSSLKKKKSSSKKMIPIFDSNK